MDCEEWGGHWNHSPPDLRICDNFDQLAHHHGREQEPYGYYPSGPPHAY
jgi:hypothetical protein